MRITNYHYSFTGGKIKVIVKSVCVAKGELLHGYERSFQINLNLWAF